ncbi:general secretion pathway protein GspL [Pseudoxanthomonas gei]|uniref:General secretion pathway protein GspL n=1 Tax=Pseudoxanthomonas gei TaxID=1383030 RepID=A0ABX0AEY3_9GAMM|nr:PilN domain-containing protein [Pseudoxanthomonas gei]NDK38036.1 general secretion pathway protein GspL [Pseudoxanthomonas gei]
MTSLDHSPALADRIRRYGVGTGSFLIWWRQALASWLPARWRVLLGLAQDRLLLAGAGEEVQLQWQNGNGVHDVVRLPLPLQDADLERVLGNRLAALPRWLVLPPGLVLRRSMLLPAAAAERLRDVVGFEVDRQTPFSAAAVRFDARLLGRRADGQLEVELVAVPKPAFEEALSALGGLAGGLVGVDALDAAGTPLGVNLLPQEQRRSRSTPMRSWNMVLVAVALLAVVATAWQVLANRRDAAAAFSAQVDASAIQARKVAIQRDRLRDIVEGAKFLDRARASRPTTVEVIDEVSRRLPDNTYLEKLAIEGDRLLLIGLSPEASALVGRMEGSSLWKSPALSGALQPDPRTRRDRFSLTADLVGTRPAATAPATGAANGDARR